MLNICRTLFENLGSNDIRYCHWKSNEHLDEALAGKTDLDVLIHEDDKESFLSLLSSLPFIEILSPPEKQFKGLEDYLGFDYSTGEFVHLHVHYQLVLGQRHIKNHHLPIEDLIFSNLTEKMGVRIPCQELELLLLIIRCHMKVDFVSLVKHGIKDATSSSGYTAFPADIERELLQLIGSVDREKLMRLLEISKIPIRDSLISEFIDRIIDKKLKAQHVLKVQREVLRSLKDYRRNKGVIVKISYGYFVLKELPFVRPFVNFKRKKLTGRGLVIALVGADGSGKSTLTEELKKWLSWKLEVKGYYFGIPKNIVNSLFHNSGRVLAKLRLDSVNSLVQSVFWIYVARVRLNNNRKSISDVKKGKIVIADRFPLNDFLDMSEPMDGPRINPDVSRIARFLSEIERRYYARLVEPDRVFVLQVALDVLRSRKTDLDISTHKEKANAVNKIRQSKNRVLVDAGQSYQEVQLEIKRHIWRAMKDSSRF